MISNREQYAKHKNRYILKLRLKITDNRLTEFFISKGNKLNCRKKHHTTITIIPGVSRSAVIRIASLNRSAEERKPQLFFLKCFSNILSV